MSSQSKSPDANDFIVLFKKDWSLFNKFNLPKLIAKLHCKRWSDIAEPLIFLRRVPIRPEISMSSVTLLLSNGKIAPIVGSLLT